MEPRDSFPDTGTARSATARSPAPPSNIDYMSRSLNLISESFFCDSNCPLNDSTLRQLTHAIAIKMTYYRNLNTILAVVPWNVTYAGYALKQNWTSRFFRKQIRCVNKDCNMQIRFETWSESECERARTRVAMSFVYNKKCRTWYDRLITVSLQVLAIKQVPVESDLQEIIKEISIMQQCDSEYIVKYYGSYFKNTDLWIVMEYCGGG